MADAATDTIERPASPAPEAVDESKLNSATRVEPKPDAAQKPGATDDAAFTEDTGSEEGKPAAAEDVADTSSEEGAFSSEDDAADTDEAGSEQEGSEVPDEYEAFDLPEGAEADEAKMASFIERAKADGLTQEQAQKRLTHVAELKAEVDQQSRDYWGGLASEWGKMSKEAGLLDKQTMSFANIGLNRLPGGSELSSMLKELGLVKHPAIITAFAAYGKEVSPDQDTAHKEPGGSRPSATTPEEKHEQTKQRMYPNEAQKS